MGLIIAALIAKAVDRAEDGAVDGGLTIGRRALDVLRARFAGEDDKEAAQALERLAEAPDSRKLIAAVGGLLEERANREPGLRAELEALIEEARQAGVDTAAIAQTAIGDGNVQVGGISDSEVNIGLRPDRGSRQ